MGLGIDFHGHAHLRRPVHDGLQVDGIRLALQYPAPCRMAQDVDVRVLDGPQQPVGHLLPILIER